MISSVAALLSSGCAISQYGPELNTSLTYRDKTFQRPIIEDLYPEEDGLVVVSTSCAGLIPYTVMMSPIIPLPPIIPTWFWKSKASVTVRLDTREDQDIGSYYLSVKQKLGLEYTLSPPAKQKTDMYTYLTFTLPSTCLDIDGTEIRLHGISVHGQPKISEPIRININPRNEFDFGYLQH